MISLEECCWILVNTISTTQRGQYMSRKKKRSSSAQVSNLELVINDRDARFNGVQHKKTFHLKDLKYVTPMTDNQSKAVMIYNSNNNIVLHGCAGTGKTFLSMFLGLRDVLDENTDYKRLVIVRSAVASRDIGFLPGTEEEKMAVYEAPYQSICNSLFTYKRSYENLKKSGYVDFENTSYQRGVTFDNAIILVDECQNLTDEEFNTILTRLGHNSKILICGDTRQKDLRNSGLEKNLKIFNTMKSMSVVEFGTEDIVRSDFVKEYIIARHNID